MSVFKDVTTQTSRQRSTTGRPVVEVCRHVRVVGAVNFVIDSHSSSVQRFRLVVLALKREGATRRGV